MRINDWILGTIAILGIALSNFAGANAGPPEAFTVSDQSALQQLDSSLLSPELD